MATTQILRTRPDLSERFEVIGVLGEGAAGAVYRVRDRKHDGKEVALKILLNNSAFDENTLDRFLAELKICQTIHHPNIVEAYDLIHLGDTIAFTMEYVAGSDLGNLFRTRRFSYSEVDDIFCKILAGVSVLHEHKVVHRDLKLENVLIGENGTVKISDLGLMKWGEFESMTRTGILLGTAQYMPPEYVRESAYDERGDVYAVGLMLYEVLTGKRRLNEKSGNEALEYLIRTQFELPRITLTGLPRKYLAIIDRATAVDPLLRYQSAEEMRQALVMLAVSPEEAEAPIKPRSIETERFCEKAVRSSTILDESINRGVLYRRAVVCTALLLCALAVPYGFKTLVPSVTLSEGNYSGSLELYGGTGYRKQMELSVTKGKVMFSSSYEYCRQGEVDLSTGAINCGRAGLRLKIEAADARHVSGNIIDVSLREQHSFSLTKK
ncbi:MAG: serine/threonine protein kinase [Oligoflexia bacterium]|nr:serine/threonine protein kinase [Oligoflexia bacterium]